MTVVKLSVHKNTKRQREAKELRKDGVQNFKNAVNQEEIAGYAYVAWNSMGRIWSGYNVSDRSPFPAQCLPEVAKISIIQRLTE